MIPLQTQLKLALGEGDQCVFKLNLFPKDKKFFVLFNELAKVLVNISAEFIEFLNQYSENYTSTSKGTGDLMACSLKLTRIMELDKEGEHLAADLRKELFSTFVTPLDREDIHGMTKILNSIIEHVTGVARRFDMYNITNVRPQAIELSLILQSCVKQVEYLINHMDNLSSLDKIRSAITELEKLEKEGDRIYRNAIKEMFYAGDQDPLEVMKWKDVYERLENAIDKCNSSGSIIMGMILKYA